MGLISISVLLASVVYVFVRPPTWMPLWFARWRQGQLPSTTSDSSNSISRSAGTTSDAPNSLSQAGEAGSNRSTSATSMSQDTNATSIPKDNDSGLMPPPPIPKITNTPALVEPAGDTTPKAKPADISTSIPVFSIDADPSDVAGSSTSPPSISMGPPPSLAMPPPPRPASNKSTSSLQTQPAGRIPTLGQFPAANSIQRARGPAPSRAPPAASSSLATPPTITTKPQKPSRKVLLEPGHSPLDWASISGPNADLRGVPPETPYLRVTPSMLKEKTGRKGKDAWMALNGKVYNVTPYAKFHPGGVPELMRGAGRDGTKLFWEIHPWVNYDTMLAACLVGLMVEEPEGSGPSKMDEMD